MKKIALLLICLMAALAFSACEPPLGDPDSLVITLPNTVTYIAGTQELDLTGGKVAVKYTSGKIKDEIALSESNDVKLEYDLRVAGTATVTVTYQTLEGTFDVTVVPAEDAVSMEVKTVPEKKTYGPYVSAGHVQKRGGEVTITFKSGETQTLPMADPLISVYSVDTESKKISVLCYGLLADFGYTLDEKEIGYVTVTQKPTRTLYRANATKADVEFTGGKYSLEVKGKVLGNYNLDDTSHRLEATAIDTKTLKYVTVERSLNTVTGYEGQNINVKGYFDISSVSEWPTAIKMTKQPTNKYLATQTAENIDLTGTEVEVTYQNSLGATTKTEKITLPHPDITVEDITLTTRDYYYADISLVFKNDIVTSQKIAHTFETQVAPGSHNDTTLFNYFVEKLPPLEKLMWSESNMLTDRQKEIAKEAVTCYLASSDRTAIATQAKTAVSYGFYVEWVEHRHGLFERLDAEIAAFAANNDSTHETAFDTNVKGLNTEFNAFVAKYSQAALKDFVLSTSSTGVETTISSRVATADEYRTRQLAPFIIDDGAVDIAKDVMAAINATGYSKENWKNGTITDAFVRAQHPDEGGAGNSHIEAAYAFLADTSPDLNVWKQADWDNARCATRLLHGAAWRADAQEIIYAYYYDDQYRAAYENDLSAPIYIGKEYERDSEGNIKYDGNGKAIVVGTPRNPEIFMLLDNDIIAPVIEEIYPMIANLARYVTFSENAFFIYEYNKYTARMAELKNNHKHPATMRVLNTYRISAYYDERQVGGTKVPAKPQQTAPLIDWATGYADIYYRGMLSQVVRKPFLADTKVNTFINNYIPILKNYVPADAFNFGNPFPMGDDTFDAEFVAIYEDYNALTPAQKGVFLRYVDVAILGDGSSFMSMMMKSYLQPKLSEAEFALFEKTLEAYALITYCAFDALTTARLDDFRRLYAEVNNINNGIQATKSAAFTTYCQPMLTFCASTKLSLDNITDDMRSLLDEFYVVNKYAKSHENSGSDVDGFHLIKRLKDFDEMFADWRNGDLEDNKAAFAKVVLAGDSWMDLYDNVRTIYKKSYDRYDEISGFTNIFEYGMKWLNLEYVKTPTQILVDMPKVLAEFNSHTRYLQFQYFYTSSTVFSGMIEDFYTELGLIDEELKFLKTYIINYYMFLMVDFGQTGLQRAIDVYEGDDSAENLERVKSMEDFLYGARQWEDTGKTIPKMDPENPTEQLRDTGTVDLFIEYMEKCVVDYGKLLLRKDKDQNPIPLSQIFKDTSKPAGEKTDYRIFAETVKNSQTGDVISTKYYDLDGIYKLWLDKYTALTTPPVPNP